MFHSCPFLYTYFLHISEGALLEPKIEEFHCQQALHCHCLDSVSCGVRYVVLPVL